MYFSHSQHLAQHVLLGQASKWCKLFANDRKMLLVVNTLKYINKMPLGYCLVKFFFFVFRFFFTSLFGFQFFFFDSGRILSVLYDDVAHSIGPVGRI